MGSIGDGQRLVSENDIQQLRQLLSGTQAEVRSPSDRGYEKSIDRWSKAAERPAGVAVAPTSAEEVSIVVKYAAQNGLDLAIKGGGHSTAGVSSTNGGILIDLQSKMRKVTVDTEKKELHIQGGALWSDVDDAAWEHGLATVGGTVADTGVGGLTLGGGYGVLSGGYGLVIDNCIAFETVVANGEIVRSSKDENEELFWGLRGAGQNFGVTTEFVLQAYPQGKIYMGTMLFPATEEVIGKLVEALNDLYKVKETSQGPQTKSKGTAMSLVGFAKPPPAEGATMVLMNAVETSGSEEEGKKMFQPFFDIGPAVNHMRMVRVLHLTSKELKVP
jgi:FAD/FMN-containing dehydrogenase